MDFGANITPVGVIKKEAFRGTYFRNIYSNVNDTWYKNSWKEFSVLKNIDQNSVDPYDWFQWYFKYWLGKRFADDERQITRWKRTVARFKSKLVVVR